jgi:hypothetical protein
MLNENGKKALKVLYIAYQFPPNGGGGVQRALRHANAMADIGYEVEVITLDKTVVEENSLVKKINSSIKIIKVKDSLLEKNSIIKSKILNKIISFLAFPDRNILWAITSYLKIKNFKYDIIFSTSHPYSSHIISLLYKLNNSQVKLVIDYRDAWTFNPSLKYTKKYPLFYFISKPLERIINKKADQIITVSLKLVKYIYQHDNKVNVVYNAYDEEDFIEREIKKDDEKFIFFYMGSLYAERNLNNFFKGFNIFINNLEPNEREKIHFKVVGINDVDKIKTEINNNISNGDKVKVEVSNYLPHDKIIIDGLNANILLLFIGNIAGSESVVTGKLLEYIKFNAPILAIVPTDGEAANIIAKTKTGMSFGENDSEMIANYMTSIFKNWVIDCNQKDFSNGRNVEEIEKFSKKNQNKKLIEILSR